MTAPDTVADQFRDLMIQAQTLLAKVEAVTPAEARGIYAEHFAAEAPRHAERAKACRQAADAMQRVADAMRAKLGTVLA